MNANTTDHGHPTRLIALSLTVCAAVIAAGAWLIAARTATSAAQPAAGIVGVAIAWAASLAGLVILGKPAVGPAILQQYVLTMLARLAVCGAGAVVAIAIVGLALEPVLLGMAGAYLPLVVVEAVLLGRSARAAAPTRGGA